MIALYEVHKNLSRKLPAPRVASCLDVMRLGRVLELTDRRAIATADATLHHRLAMAMADAVMFSMAIEHGAIFWTQNVDDQGLPSVTCFPRG